MSNIDTTSMEDQQMSNGGLFGASQTGAFRMTRYFTTEGIHPYDEVIWEHRYASITAENGEVIFEAHDVEMPDFWSATAGNVVISKYFRIGKGKQEREKSLRTLINRVVDTISTWGLEDGYFQTQQEATIFAEELAHLVLYQKAAFNSPVWFNVGVDETPQCSACFINAVDDTMDSILGLARTEGMLFKFGSGTGTNFSSLRSSKEKLSSGGFASGPVSFMRGFDSFAGVIKSGGRTRRAAKMVILDVEHPDIREFINCKAHEEKKAWALIDAGYDGSFGGEAYDSVMFQNSNNSVRVTDDFMDAVIRGREWQTLSVVGKVPTETIKAQDLLKEVAAATHLCGDPGIQYDTTINEWHTCPESGRINASNPCSEYMFLDDSACNLASLNLMKFRKPNGDIDVPSFRRAITLMILAQEIIIERAGYPTTQITQNSKRYRPLGLGYANLGALLMSNGLPYDSDEGRAMAATITAILTGQAYLASAEIASRVGTFADYMKNREPFLHVIGKHRSMVDRIERLNSVRDLIMAARQIWDEALAKGEQFGYRNAQVTVLAPTGTIGFMMDCDTTGIEPDIALVKYKKLSGGGMFKIVNQTVPAALQQLGYTEAQISEILLYIEGHDTIEGAAGLKDEHLPVFDCAFKPANGLRAINYMGHLRMMSAVQPFLSGAISKTVNMPHEATVQDIYDVYVEAWRLRLKSVAVYRDGCKRTQPLNVKLGSKAVATAETAVAPVEVPVVRRRRLPEERQAITHKFSVAGHEGYITVGQYDDGTPGEIFVKMSKQGSVVSGLMDSFAIAISMALQYGVPLNTLIDKFSHSRFEPSGWTGNKDIPMAKSVVDYIFRWMALRYMPRDMSAHYVSSTDILDLKDEDEDGTGTLFPVMLGQNGNGSLGFDNQSDAPPCPTCGEIMVRNGACYKCMNCGSTSGCS